MVRPEACSSIIAPAVTSAAVAEQANSHPPAFTAHTRICVALRPASERGTFPRTPPLLGRGAPPPGPAEYVPSVLQRDANRRVPRAQNLSWRLIWSLLHQPRWFGGVLAITAGFLLQASTLGAGELSVMESPRSSSLWRRLRWPARP